MSPKRKATSPVRPVANKRRRSANGGDGKETTSEAGCSNYHASRIEAISNIYYPSEISNERCEQYTKNQRQRPYDVLRRALETTQAHRDDIAVGESVVHWFKRDLRICDNRALALASKKSQAKNVPLICMFIVSPQDYEAHSTSAARVDFELRTLEVLQRDLAEMDVPLHMSTVEARRDLPEHLLAQCREWGAKHVFCNIEYEVDELRRESRLVRLCAEAGIDFTCVNDDVVVPPEALKTGGGKPYSVYSPFYRSWVRYLHAHRESLQASGPLVTNPATARQRFAPLFGLPVPPAPLSKALSSERQSHLARLWPAGERAAQDRLARFLDERISAYKTTRNDPSANSTSKLSPHLSLGTISARTAVRLALEANTSKQLDEGDAGISGWLGELAWRDFYKHVLVYWPYICMAKPFKWEYSDIEWSYDKEAFQRWCEGRTGFPLVDAGMRQLNSMAWMHNRVRMVCASFLAKDLLIDWRLGERYFMEQLVDGDFASNNGGWGFSASTGVDPQPYFRIFNPVLQSEKFDPDGAYIRRWVGELEGIQGKAVHDPYGRKEGPRVEKAGYPKMMVDHRGARDRALEAYKKGLGRSTANVGGGVHN